MTDSDCRRQALECAVTWSRRRKVSADTVIAVAQQFEGYLSGERAKRIEELVAQGQQGTKEQP